MIEGVKTTVWKEVGMMFSVKQGHRATSLAKQTRGATFSANQAHRVIFSAEQAGAVTSSAEYGWWGDALSWAERQSNVGE